MIATVTPTRGLRGEIRIPGDKSISHRAVMFASIAQGKSRVKGFSASADAAATVDCLRRLGSDVSGKDGAIEVRGQGLLGLAEPDDVLNAANSGTTVRLLSGILSGQPFLSIFTGDDSLRQRPMKRIVTPLTAMGALIRGRNADQNLPLAIRGGLLRPISYSVPVASAQVKSAILLAALYAEGETTVIEPQRTRDHSERMLAAMGARIVATDDASGHRVTVEGRPELQPLDVEIPGDFSSAAFFMAAAAVVPDSDITVLNVGINPTRTGFMDVLREMGAHVEVFNQRLAGGEPVAEMRCRAGDLRGVSVSGEMVARAIDELPVLAVVATQAEGETIVRDAQELRVKESDRIAAVVRELSRLGADIAELPDGFIVRGPTRLRGTRCSSYGDHRIAMSLAIAGLVATDETQIDGVECVDVSFPGFFDRLSEVIV